jgi:hypothetical protein
MIEILSGKKRTSKDTLKKCEDVIKNLFVSFQLGDLENSKSEIIPKTKAKTAATATTTTTANTTAAATTVAATTTTAATAATTTTATTSTTDAAATTATNAAATASPSKQYL